MGSKNALSELAEDLKVIADWTNGGYGFTAISKAQRIVAELAKVGYWKSTGRPHFDDAVSAVSNCRAIAEGRENEESEGVVK